MAAAMRNAVLKHLRVKSSSNTTPLLFSNLLFRRNLCEQVKGSFLDKSEVADRVITVVKNFQKVDPSKGAPAPATTPKEWARQRMRYAANTLSK
ncbi:hypothetical protein IFM89_035485 [Coptis chinensis]|uniref:Uncharacterized protein n=1 Tax=Coptis chinensis TaxID=261450 RepID=A0A835H911_9MAGN|nr:hypothetical protein IFM89_035485 [Coptis chinensis]